MARPHYQRSPIVEVIISIDVVSRDGLAMQQLREVGEQIKSTHPKESSGFEIKSEQLPDGGEKSLRLPIGFMYQSNDDLRAAQVRLKGFTYNALFNDTARYVGWNSLSVEAKTLWDVYKKFLEPKSVTRILVRYINRINIPAPVKNLSEYITAIPVVPDALRESSKGQFALQLRMLQSDIGATAVFNEAIVPPMEPEHASLMIDIGVINESDDEMDISQSWEQVEAFHERVGTIFESSITEQCRTLFT